jgi:S1-C subfamily serine protease
VIKIPFILVAALMSACSLHQDSVRRGDVIRHAVGTTVQLYAVQGDSVRRAGSGIVLGTNQTGKAALVLTTEHFLRKLQNPKILVNDAYRKATAEAVLVTINRDLDLALLAVRGMHADRLVLRDQAQLGDPVWAVAFPWGKRRTVVSGVVSQIRWLQQGRENVPIDGPVILIDAAVSYGASGGGVYHSDDGALAGMIRGYRSTELSLPGEKSSTLTIPAAGETTVIPAADIIAFLRKEGLDYLIAPRQ